jgi:hypothetical protein
MGFAIAGLIYGPTAAPGASMPAQARARLFDVEQARRVPA